MNFLNKLERKIGKYALPNLSLYLILCYAAGYLVYMINPGFLMYLTLNPFEIMRGQIWRLVTWILIPPGTQNIFFLLIMLMFYYSIGTTLERTWGTFYFNVYIFGGIIFTVIASFVMAGYLYAANKFGFSNVVLELYEAVYKVPAPNGSISLTRLEYLYQVYLSGLFTTYYINMSMFLAYAATYPDMQVLLMFIIPIKVKYLGIVYAALIVLEILQSQSLLVAFVIVASMLNFLIFFLLTRKKRARVRKTVRQVRKQMEYQAYRRAEERQAQSQSQGTGKKQSSLVTRHKCAICGRTERDDPALEFRFCSKCEGNYEYCQDHLFTHEHVHRS